MRISLRCQTAALQTRAAELRRQGYKRDARRVLHEAVVSRICDERQVAEFRNFLTSHPFTARAIAMRGTGTALPA